MERRSDKERLDMKRKAKSRAKDTYSIWTLFEWLFCELCKKEFRRERGWRVHLRRNSTPLYVCNTCASSALEAEKKSIEYFKLTRPPAPKAPPHESTSRRI